MSAEPTSGLEGKSAALCARLLAAALLVSAGMPAVVAGAGSIPSFVEPITAPLAFSSGGDVIGVATGDFNGDGKLDLAATQETNVPNFGFRGFVSIPAGNGDGTFQTPTDIPMAYVPTVAFARGILAEDFDGDGALDLVVAV